MPRRIIVYQKLGTLMEGIPYIYGGTAIDKLKCMERRAP
jgi:hypothetical protein